MKKTLGLFLVFGLLVALLFNTGCRKEQFGNGNLTFSTDTLTFDTVFTSLGSTTRYFKVFNTDNKAVRISDISLLHLVGNQFRINVDGVDGDHFEGVEIPAKDSIYIFVEVTVDPNSNTTPFVIIDDVEFTANGSTSKVHLQAFGQNAHFHYGEEITGTTIWSNDLPHVIVDKGDVPGVFVKCNATLNIQSGCDIFFAGSSAIFVEGTLRAEAALWSDSIVFQGARLENYYDDKPGQWFGIVFLRDTNQTSACAGKGFFDHCVINESSYGIYPGAGLSSDLNKYMGDGGRPEVSIKNSIVKNSQYNGVYGFNANITAENSIFYAAGDNLLKFGLGGEYSFTNCTIYNTGSRYLDHKTETVLLSNFVADGNNDVYPEAIKTTFENCVIYGSLRNEISFNNINENPFDLAGFDNSFIYSALKTDADTLALFSTINDNNQFNREPRFEKVEEGNFAPSDSAGYFSPLIDYCPDGLSPDIFGTVRPVSKTDSTNKFDIGAIEAK